MYLTEIDENTGLLSIGQSKDGVTAIKEFRVILDKKGYGIECLTAIALTADYLTPFRHYDENDRPRAAMEEVTGNRDKWPWKDPIIQNALIKYRDLQFDPDLEEMQLHKQRKINIINKIKLAESLDDEERIEKNLNIGNLTKNLRNINNDIEAFNKRVNKSELYTNAPTDNGYSLSRIEQKLLKKRSHYNANVEM